MADVSTHLRQLYNSEPLVLKTEHTELVNINDADFKKKMRIRAIPVILRLLFAVSEKTVFQVFILERKTDAVPFKGGNKHKREAETAAGGKEDRRTKP